MLAWERYRLGIGDDAANHQIAMSVENGPQRRFLIRCQHPAADLDGDIHRRSVKKMLRGFSQFERQLIQYIFKIAIICQMKQQAVFCSFDQHFAPFLFQAHHPA